MKGCGRKEAGCHMQTATSAMVGMDEPHPAIDSVAQLRVFCNCHVLSYGLRPPQSVRTRAYPFLRLGMGAKPTTRLESSAGCCDRVSRGRRPSTWLGSPVIAALGCLRTIASMTQPRAGNVGNAHGMRETKVQTGRARETAPSVPYQYCGKRGFIRALPLLVPGGVSFGPA